MNPDDSIKMRRARKVVDNGTGPFAIPLAQLTEAIISNDKLDALTESIRSIEMPEYPEIEIPEYPTDITVSNLPEVQKVEVLNFPEQKAPIVNVPAPVVNIPAPIVNVEAQETQEIDITPIAKEVAKIRAMLESEEKDDTDFEKLFKDLGEKISNIKTGGGFGGGASILQTAENTVGVKPLSGSSSNGTRELTSANTWYAVPSTVPTSAYNLIVTLENASGDIRWGYDNTGTPSATNGNRALDSIERNLAGGQVIYFASSVAGDDVNWTTKII